MLQSLPSPYHLHYRRRLHQEAQYRQDRYRLAWRDSRRAAALLRRKFAVKGVWLFGSTLSCQFFHETSDLDLAVWGLPLKDYCSAVGELLFEIEDFSIDLVRLEEAQASLRQAILVDGFQL